MTRRVLVTRPQPGADATAARLAAMGFVPVVLPLTRIVAIEPAPAPDPEKHDAVVATSANALRHAPPRLLAALAARPLFAVGDATAGFARESGFRDVRSASGTAIDLAAAIDAALRPGARLLHLAGTERTAGFDEALRRSGFAVEIAETYRAAEISHTTDFLKSALSDGPIWGALAFSERGGRLLAKLSARASAREHFEKTSFFCISDKAAAPLRAFAGSRIAVSSAPTEDGVLALLSP